MQVRVCNRCHAPVPALPSSVRVTIPVSDPAIKPAQVTADFGVDLSIAVQGDGVDLCPVCLMSAFVEYALVVMKTSLTPAIANALQQRIDSVLGYVVASQTGTV